MSLDIFEGDILVVDGVEYPIRGISRWTSSFPGTSFNRLATCKASTKRNPEMVAGKRGAATVNLTGLFCTPLDRPNPDNLQFRADLKSPYKLRETFIHAAGEYLNLLVEEVG